MDVRNGNDKPEILGHNDTVRIRSLVGKGELFQMTNGRALRSVSEFELVAGHSLSPHRHPFPEFYYVLTGSLEIQIEQEAVILTEGDFVVIPPGCAHTLRHRDGVRENTRLFAFSLATPEQSPLVEDVDLEHVEAGVRST